MPRQTTRQILTDLFEQKEGGFSFGELVSECQRVRTSIHKSTVLRNLRRLVAEGAVVSCARRGKRPVYTQARSTQHLHATLCRYCPRLRPLPAATLRKVERVLHEVEAELGRTGEFTRLRHTLQFEGECVQCAEEK